MRCDEDLTRGDMEARWKEISWLMEQRISPFIVLAWQTGVQGLGRDTVVYQVACNPPFFHIVYSLSALCEIKYCETSGFQDRAPYTMVVKQG